MTFTFEASVVSNGNTLKIKDNAVTFNGKPVALDCGKTTLFFGSSAPAGKSARWIPRNYRV